jgi:hypothetical protein
MVKGGGVKGGSDGCGSEGRRRKERRVTERGVSGGSERRRGTEEGRNEVRSVNGTFEG